MKIAGLYTEVANLQRSVKKEDNVKAREESTAQNASASRPAADTVELSEGARKALEVRQLKSKLKEIPDPREEKINDVLNRLRNGALLNPESVKASIGKMLDSGIL